MKKIFALMALALSFGFTACDDPSDTDIDAGGVKVKKMCGDWYVSVYATDDEITDPSQLEKAQWEVLDGMEDIVVYTYNTAANKKTEMYLDDNKEIEEIKTIVKVNYGAKKFEASESENEYNPESPASVYGGKVLLKAGTRANGVKADSIVFYLPDEELGYVKVAGLRRP